MNIFFDNLLQKTKQFASYSLLATLPLAASIAKADKITMENVGFATPESAEYFAAEDVYLINNINGSPFAKDDNGFISKVSPEGKIIELKWIDGAQPDIALDAPKGMSIIGNKLYVADIDQIRIFDVTTGKALKSIEVEGASFLNGVTAAQGDAVYVSDTGLAPGFTGSLTDAIYKIDADGSIETLVKDPKMGRPNGVLYAHNVLHAVYFSEAKMSRINADGSTQTLPAPPAARLDGFVELNDGGFAISSWQTSSVYRYRKGRYSMIIEGLTSPADMGMDSKRNRLLIPLFKENKLVILPLGN
ncbi:hypothetical protein [Thiomicrorhabdus sediminis]|uniref:SMP-30/Gluconolaconase/LRE-like region-containing protein n=1 Tax=Thiomicrorhabdus sediminis TaxID=2580412 RepID=A0A4P9K463_9GAMM|nr:hypothetical protein [Thiomicrorhabdus sediminis]QCU89678.1 hypothetical protein FE785_03010 [Thiomicrorhabdus sediminis]